MPLAQEKYKYEYNDKEFQREFSLNWNDYGARNHDASLGRWVNLDALAEGRNWLSELGSIHSHPNEYDVINSMDGDVWVGRSYHYKFGNDKPYYIYFNRKNGNLFVYKILPNKTGDAAKRNTHRKFITF